MMLHPAGRASRRPGKSAGFTLIEVLVALFIAGTALIAVATVVSDSARNLQMLQERTWAHWAAMNHIVEFQLEEKWPAEGSKTGNEKSSLFPVFWKREVVETPYDRVRKIKLEIYHDKFDKKPLTTLTTYTGRETSW
jgi:general secretion pathway protein I